jgi:dipeptidyl aminopeptidase/acylaminoacyl peptidase
MRVERLGFVLMFAGWVAAAQQPFTLQQVLSAPYALQLSAAPVGDQFAWSENAEGRRNLWVGTAGGTARQVTGYTEDDAQDINDVAWSGDGQAIAYTYGAEDGADGRPANPAHLQRATTNVVMVQPLTAGAAAINVGEGRHPLFTRDGKDVLFVRGGQIWMADLGGKTEVRQMVFDRGSASGLTLSPDGSLLAFVSHRRTTDGPSHSFVALFNLGTHELSFPAASTGEDAAPVFSPDGRQLAWLRGPYTREPDYTPHLRSANPWSIEVLDVATRTVRQVYAPAANQLGSALPHVEDSSPYLLWAPGNRIIFYSEASGFGHPYIVAAEGGKARDLLADLQPQIVEVEDAVVSKDGKSLLYVSAGPFMSCVAAKCDRDFSLKDAPDTRTVWRVALDGERPLLPVPLTPEKVIATHPVQLADGTLGALVSSARFPMHPAIVTPEAVASVDTIKPPVGLRGAFEAASYPAKRLVEPERVDFNAAGVVVDAWPTKLADVVTADPEHIHAQLFLPQGIDETRRHAAIVFVHGGPNRQMLLGYPGMDYYSNAYAMNQYLASLGFIVLSVNYRGGTGYGLEFREAAHYGPDGASEYGDVLSAQKYLAKRADVDAARIGIWGGSYGGYLTALALARNSNLFAAGVDFHGVHEWSLEGSADSWMPDAAHATAAQRDAGAALAHASSPMADVDKWRSPVLLIHGDNDPEVNFAQTPVLADALRARHVAVEELIFPDEVHGFLLHKDWLAAYAAEAAFFVRVLQP